MQLLTEDIRAFTAAGSRSLLNIRQIAYRLPDGTPIGQARQVSNALGKLSTVTGMDKGNAHSFDLSEGKGPGAAHVVASPYGSPPATTIELPATGPLGRFRYVASGMVAEDATGAVRMRVERPVGGEDKPSRKQASLFIIQSPAGRRLGQLACPLPGQKGLVETIVAIDEYLLFWDRAGSRSVLGDSNYTTYQIALDEALSPELRPYLACLPIAVRFGYHDETPGLRANLAADWRQRVLPRRQGRATGKRVPAEREIIRRTP